MKLVAPHRRRGAGEFPPGWDEWVDRGAGARPAAAPPEALTLAIAARGVAPPLPGAPELGRWDSFKALCREQWDPPDAEDRPMRRVAWLVAVGWHVFVAVALVWLMYQQYLAPAHPPQKGQEDVVQIEFIGEGATGEVGGGPEAEAAAAQPAASAAEASASAAASGSQAPPTPVEPTPVVAASEPAPPMPAVVPEQPVSEAAPPQVPQNVEVSEPAPDVSDYQLPPPMAALPVPQVTVPERSPVVPEMVVVEVPSRPAPVVPAIAARPIADVTLQPTPSEVVVREIAAPLPTAPTVTVPKREVALREHALTPAPIREREIPSPAPPRPASPPASAATATATAPASTASSESAVASERKRAASAAAADAAAMPSNAGPKTATAPGGWDTRKRADDWGESTRNVEGGQKGTPAGLYNSDGSVRLAETPGSASPARPPGALTDEIVNLDRAGTWLKRKPTDYEPTSFDRYWRPSETLLEEWVRKSVTTIRIPIPGTNKHVVCQTVLLVVGGGCDISDPNLLDVPATARPAPDIPFKPGLQEDNGSLPAPVEQ
ncbi:hypothetical protein INQ41_06380 [Lysobacter ciconiae]|uniref:Transmembrane repetitive protein n=1 Tax=Novilysobacter ciconiae TaxID=2781022 RepID=A0A7S6UHY2_9GAMM|nr:hypothetical protein [Lysobacter ciconiae]QOW20622.1 hypothetical protein INQ41_06380 [Lysobacter ciconiae]